MRIVRTCLCVALSGSLACSVGTKASDYRPAQTPMGVHASLSLDHPDLEVEGELLAVEDTALIVLWADGSLANPVCFVPLRRISMSDFPQMHSDDYVHHGEFASPDAQQHLRLVSRFPQGMSEKIRDRLFAHYHQTQFNLPGIN